MENQGPPPYATGAQFQHPPQPVMMHPDPHAPQPQQQQQFAQQPQEIHPVAPMQPYPGQAPPPGFVNPQVVSMHDQNVNMMHQQQQFAQPAQYDVKTMPQENVVPMQAAAPMANNLAYLTVAVTPLQNLGANPALIDCPCCSQRALTNTNHKIGNTNHAWGIGLCVLTCHLCWIPYLFTSLKDVEHRCGHCGTLLATWHRSGKTDVHFHAAGGAPAPLGQPMGAPAPMEGYMGAPAPGQAPGPVKN